MLMNVVFDEPGSLCQYTYEIIGRAILLANNYHQKAALAIVYFKYRLLIQETHGVSVQEETDTSN